MGEGTHAESSWMRIVVVAALVVGGLWVCNMIIGVQAWFVAGPSGAGEFGDMFGAVNALFSGLALGGIVVALFMQRHDLAIQQKALAEQLNEQRRLIGEHEEARKQYERTALAQEKAVQAQLFKQVYDYIIATEKDRKLVFHRAESLRGVKTSAGWRGIETRGKDGDLIDAVHNVANCYHYIGFLKAANLLTDMDAFLDEAGHTIRRVYEILAPIIGYQRELRNSPEYKKYFDQLYQLAVAHAEPGAT